ncbi:MAG: type VII toxin-antitoxin system MntA family adenylyltransferase antitoxin [Thermoleophilaceae bacterium]
MSKVDERAVVPEVDAHARARLAAALDREPVVAASLFGSQATGRPGPLSDVDIAVWLDPALAAADRAQTRLDLVGAAAATLDTGEVDVVILNDAPPLLCHRAARDGRRILDREPRARVRLETASLLEYLDTAPLRATLAEGRRRRLQEGRFGRR